MFYCHICGSTEARKTSISEIFQIDNKPVLVEHIPAMVCTRCGEAIFSQETTEGIRKMVHSETKPVKSISINVFDFLRIYPSRLIATT